MVIAGALTGLALFVVGKGLNTPNVTPVAAVFPERIDIPSIDVSAPLMKLGLTKGGEVELPPFEKPKMAGWYEHSVVPGDEGPSVIIGHVDTKDAPAVFFKLRQLRKGQIVEVERSDGKTARYKVDSIEQVNKNSFPTDRVYLDDGLKLVTCGGTFDYARHEYVDNIIVYASKA